ncbi:MAG TPA: protein kinase [Thermoanaerobaculia bacterium]|nr:protein kinase [Thermoanaerobaculia bacterium]
MPIDDPLGSSRFQVRRRIGAGSFGIVYEAFDPVRNKVVAVKALKQATPEALYRFKREFRALSDIAERNLVRLYELISEGEHWLVSMELIRGRNFIEYVRGAPFTHNEGFVTMPSATPKPATSASPADPVRLGMALPQLGTGLIALHNAGKLHRDIKPSNVLVADDHRVVLLDFGLVIDTDRYSLDATEATSGTPAYMSPEQGAGDPLGPPSDWYSVGVMLYEALAGRVPFHGTYLDVLNAKRAGDVAPPSSIATGVPQHLDDLCRDLLRLDPAARPTADEILRRLGDSPPRIITTAPAASPFIGREHHLRTLREAFEATMEGAQTTVCVQGVSGAGKTALIRAFVEQLRDEVPDLLVLTARCYQRESVPYKGIDSLVDALHRYLSRLDPAEIDALMPRDIAAAEQLFPVLRDLGDLMRMRRRVVPPLIPDQQELRRRAFATIRELLVRLADRTKLVIVIDDLQWGDVDSAELLHEVLRPPDAAPLLFIASYRSDAAATSPFVAAFRHGLVARDLAVEPLTPDESRHLALQLLGDSVRDPIEVANLVVEESGGNPLFINELARAFTMAGPDVAALRRGNTIREVLQVRLASLDPPALGLLQMISVHARPILRAPLHRALSGGAFEKTLSTLAAQHLIRTRETVEGEAVEPYHDRLAEAAMAMLSPEELRQRHAQLAEALEKFEADAELLADHLLAAGIQDRAAVYVERAAEKAAAAVAFDRAARLYRRAVTLSPENADALRRRLAEILVNAGRGHEAAAEFLAVEPHDLPDELELRRNAAQQLLISGHVDEGLAVIRTILASIDIPFPETRGETIKTLLTLRAKLALRGLRFKERALSEIPTKDLLRLDTCRAVALGLSSVDTMRGAVFQSRYLLLALDAGDPQRVAHALTMECGYSAIPGTRARRRTQKLTSIMRGITDRLGTPYARAFADEAEGVVASLQGRWRDGAEKLEAAERAFLEHCTGVTFELNTARLFGMRCRQFLGDMKVICERFPSLLRDAEDRGDRYFATSIVLFSHYVYLIDDDPETASARIESAIAEWSHAGFHVQHVWHLRAAVEIALYQGDGMRAWTRLSQSWREARQSLVSRVQFTRMMLEDVRGRAALAAGLPAVAEKAAKRLDAEDADWGRALAMMLRGQLTEAEPLLEKLEMHLHAAAVRMRLGNDAGRQWMLAQGIRNPEALAKLLLP